MKVLLPEPTQSTLNLPIGGGGLTEVKGLHHMVKGPHLWPYIGCRGKVTLDHTGKG